MISKGKIAGILTTLLLALTIFSISVLRSATVNFAYSPMVLSDRVVDNKEEVNIDYLLAHSGKIRPDNPLWYAKVLRDRIWLTFTFNNAKKAELNLLFADKRLGSSIELFKDNKPDLGLSTLTKAEKYLDTAESLMTEDKDLYKKIGLASLKHRELIENEILPRSPEDIRPEVIKASDYSKETYKKVRDHMLSIGQVPPDNPFESN